MFTIVSHSCVKKLLFLPELIWRGSLYLPISLVKMEVCHPSIQLSPNFRNRSICAKFLNFVLRKCLFTPGILGSTSHQQYIVASMQNGVKYAIAIVGILASYFLFSTLYRSKSTPIFDEDTDTASSQHAW